ncbi:MAG: hypothetical protein M0P13_03450 [Fibrobacteraceae bacterium]|nr:hypothetical protein [Fibrobacteraceae bacterium]
METILILVGLVLLQAVPGWLKKRAEKKRAEAQRVSRPDTSYPVGKNETSEASSESHDSLQDLIRKFNEEQKKRFSDEDLPPGGSAEESGKESGGEEAEEDLPDEEGFPPEPLEEDLPAKPVFEEKKKNVEVKKHFETASFEGSSRPAPAPSLMVEPANKAPVLHVEDELEKIHSAAWKDEIGRAPKSVDGATQGRPVLSLNIKEARKGFLWAKVLDDPRFKRRSPLPLNPYSYKG